MKPLKPCNLPGCPNLVKSGYCKQHDEYNNDPNRFDLLTEKKDEKTIKFYRSPAWTKASKAYRKLHPICQRCEKKGVIKPVQLVHHTTSLQELLLYKLNPLSYKYLQSLCISCHQKELRAKKNH